MNQNLINIADNLPNLRKVLNIRQAELSDLMEISRPTLIKIEQNPTKFNYPLAINLFTSIIYILESDKKIISSCKENPQKALEIFLSLLSNGKKLISFSQSNINCILNELFPECTKDWRSSEEYYVNFTNENFNNIHVKFISILEQYLDRKKVDSLKFLGVDNLDIIEFIQKIK